MDNEGAIKRFKSGVVSIDGHRSEKQEDILREFMHADFDNWHVTDGRGGVLKVEYPVADIVERNEWDDSLNTIVLPEWQSLHPKLKRSIMIARFVPKLYDFNHGVETGGNATIPKSAGKVKEHWIRVPFINHGELNTQQNLLFTIVHELAEIDFWQKTTVSEWKERHREDLVSLELLKAGRNHEYSRITDEEIANLRAERAMKRKWPDYKSYR